MKNIKRSFVIILILLTSSCNESPKEFKLISPSEAGKTESADYCADYVTALFANKVHMEKGLILTGTGGGGSSEKGLTMLSVSFEKDQKIDLSEARKLIVECTDEFVSEINSSLDLKKHLFSVPFTYENIKISILFVDQKEHEFVSPPFISAIRISEGEIRYKIHENDHLKMVKEETYEEALEILEQSENTSNL